MSTRLLAYERMLRFAGSTTETISLLSVCEIRRTGGQDKSVRAVYGGIGAGRSAEVIGSIYQNSEILNETET